MQVLKSRQSIISNLSSKILESVDTGEVVQAQLSTSQRIIARVTDGIYREPWAAFRELIANSYDADATRVIVDTGAPDFKQVVVRDDGNGMTPQTVAYIINSIGGSSKRTHLGEQYNTVASDSVNRSPKGRTLIGKIGIGLFAVAQLTQHFQIITKAKGSNIRTSATIKLTTHDEDQLAEGDEDDEYIAGVVAIAVESVPESEIDTHGTSIVLYDLRPEIRRSLQSYNRWRSSESAGPDGKPVRELPQFHIGVLPNQIPGLEEGVDPLLPWSEDKEPLEKFHSLVKAAANYSGRSNAPANLEHFDEYLRLLWKLSLSLPLQYSEAHPFDFTGSSGMIFLNMLEKIKSPEILTLKPQETLRDKLNLKATPEMPNSPFAILIDGVELRRPIILPTKLRRSSRLPSPMILVSKVENAFQGEDLKRAGGQLSFEAYLYWNSQIIPKETSGVLIRVGEASGTLFDKSFLDYQISEQNRLSQITAEIFITEGLDGAINIDREAFNYSHPHYLYIQKWLHKALRVLINKNKSIASEHLKTERETEKTVAQASILSNALTIWSEHRGEASDLPIDINSGKTRFNEVGGVEIDWGTVHSSQDDTKSSAIAIVLEAYGVLGQLSSEDRSSLIRDLIKVLDQQ